MNKHEYRAYLATPHWQMTRLKKLRGSHFQCDSCKATDQLQVHHLTYKTLGRESVNDLMVLCEHCHNTIHALWPRIPSFFTVLEIRAMTRHFLLYCRGKRNPEKGNTKARRKANHGLNKLPNRARLFLKSSIGLLKLSS